MAREKRENRRDDRRDSGRRDGRQERRGDSRSSGRNEGRGAARSERGRNESRKAAPAGRGRSEERKAQPAARARRNDSFADAKWDEPEVMELPEGLLVGRNPVMEALKSDREVTKLLVANGAEGSIKKIVGMARDKNVPIQFVDTVVLDRTSLGGPHQGVIAYVSEFEYCEISDILAKAEEKCEDPFIIILDGIEDPHNLGAIIRTTDASGAHGVIIPKRRAASVTAVAEKSAAGATAYVPVARVNNISKAIEELQEAGVWVAATDMDGDVHYKANLKGPVALVIGSEGRGISRLVKEKCDFCVSIPMAGGVNSLNASNAAAVLMYEVVRQRMAGE